MNHRPSSLPLLLLAVTVAVACLGAAGAVRAEPPFPTELDDETVTKAFWDCDVRATQEALSAGDGATCVMLTEALKQRRFDGDFTRLLAWWRQQRHEEYARRGAALPKAAVDTNADELALQTP